MMLYGGIFLLTHRSVSPIDNLKNAGGKGLDLL
jgi:hypothetical protein